MLQPPTDNLYKFLAIFGLVLIGFSVFAPLQRYELAAQETVKSDNAHAALWPYVTTNYRASALGFECSVLGTNPELYKGKPKPHCVELPKLQAKAKALEGDYNRLRILAAGVDRQHALAVKHYYLYLWVGLVVGGLGAALSVAGFWLWYVRLQVFQDAAVRKDAGIVAPPASKPKRNQ